MSLPALRDPDEAWLATMTVLVVGEDDSLRDPLERALGHRVRQVVHARDGVRALDLFRGERPSLVLLDVAAEGSGRCAVLLVEELQRYGADVPIVAIGSEDGAGQVERLVEAGASKVLRRPLDLGHLDAALLGCARRLRHGAMSHGQELGGALRTPMELPRLRPRAPEPGPGFRVDEPFLRAVYESALDAFWVADGEGRILDANPAACALLGYRRDELLQLTVTQLKADRGGTPALLRRYGERSADRFEARLRHKDGSVVVVEISPRRLPAGQGLQVGFLRDISELRRTELELLDAKLAAERLLRAKSEFLANMSHEIRTPMNGMLGMVELLSRTPLTGEQQEYLESITGCGASLLTIINDILDLSKLEAGRFKFESIPFDLGALVYELVELNQGAVDGEAVELLVDYDPAIPARLLGDPTRLRQVLGNLLSNAIKFTPAGHVLVTATLLDLDLNRARLRLAVSDTGIGIAAEAKAQLFQPFAQEDASTSRRFGGTGLGLALCRRIVEVLGGSIGLQSEPGRGSTFEVLLDLPVSDGLEERRPGARSLRGVRALAVGESSFGRELLAKQLRLFAAEVEEASTVEGARAALARPGAPPLELVVLDQRGPDLDGERLARELRGDPSAARLCLVMLTSARGGREESLARAAGFDACVVKPVRPELLARALWMVLDRRRAGKSGPLITHHTLSAARLPAAAPDTDGARLTARVLLAEDNEVNQRVARRMLEQAGATVSVVGDGAAAVEAALRGAFDLVLMDCQMPGTDGFDATRQLRVLEQARGGHLPVIAMTAYALSGDRERCLAAGMDDYLTKPILRDQLLSTVRRWSGNAAAAPAPAAQPGPARGEEHLAPVQSPPPLAGPDMDLARFREVAELLDDPPGVFASDFLRRYLESSRTNAAELAAALARTDLPQAARAAHALVGGSHNLGFNGLAEAAGRIEALLRREQGAEASASVPGMLEELERVAAYAATVN